MRYRAIYFAVVCSLLAGCSQTADDPTESTRLQKQNKDTNQGSCPDVCGALCNGDPEPPVPAGCPVPMCNCAGDPSGNTDGGSSSPPPANNCPDVCAAVCSGQPEPPLPAGCPVPTCDCPDDCVWVKSECAAPCAPDCCPMICQPQPTCQELNAADPTGTDAELKCGQRPDCEWVKLGCAAACAPDCCPGICRDADSDAKTPCGHVVGSGLPTLFCDSITEICVESGPVGPSSTFACRPIPAACQNNRTCGCVAALCTGAFDTCHDVTTPNTVFCECPQCQ